LVAASENKVAPAGEEPRVIVVERAVLPASIHFALLGIFLIMLIASLNLARAIVLPVVLASLLTLAASPLVDRLARYRISPAFSAILLVGVLAVVVGIAALLLSPPIADMITHAPDIAQTLRNRIDQISQPFLALGEASKVVSAPGSVPGTAAGGAVTVIGGTQPSIFDWLLGTLADVGSTIVATLLLAPFLLASTEILKLKLVRAFPLLRDKKRSLRVLHDIEERVSRFLVTISIINFGLGTLIGIAMWLLGMPNPLLWGVGAALLNYVPYIGPFTGITLAAAVSLTIHQDLIATLIPPLAYATLNSIEGTLVTPLTVGRRLSLNIVAILIAIGLATWMWGIVGTIIAVPLLVVVKVFCDEFPALAGIGGFISADTDPIDERDEEIAAAGPEPAMAPEAGVTVGPRS
jgi:predicted PurR-regulated permease PerM